MAFAFSFYTCYLVLKAAPNDSDFTDAMYVQFGRKGYVIGLTCFILTFYVPIILFF